MSHLIENLLVFAARLAVLAVFTFAFVVLLEHGPAGFPEGVKTEWQILTGAKKPAPPAPAVTAKSPHSGA